MLKDFNEVTAFIYNPEDIHEDYSKIRRIGFGAFSNVYMSPEALKGRRRQTSSDIFSLGIVLFEIVIGKIPRRNKKGYCDFNGIEFDDSISYNVSSFIFRMLEESTDLRLTLDEIKQHNWFKDIDWNKIKKKRTIPPFSPSINENLKYIENDYAEYNNF